MADRIMTRHPAGKRGVNIQADKYSVMRDAILRMLRRYHKCTFGELSDLVQEEIGSTFDGSITWYYTTVKLDLEARGVIVCDRRARISTIMLAEEIR